MKQKINRTFLNDHSFVNPTKPPPGSDTMVYLWLWLGNRVFTFWGIFDLIPQT